jgi:hypothetical protein
MAGAPGAVKAKAADFANLRLEWSERRINHQPLFGRLGLGGQRRVCQHRHAQCCHRQPGLGWILRRAWQRERIGTRFHTILSYQHRTMNPI